MKIIYFLQGHRIQGRTHKHDECIMRTELMDDITVVIVCRMWVFYEVVDLFCFGTLFLEDLELWVS